MQNQPAEAGNVDPERAYGEILRTGVGALHRSLKVGQVRDVWMTNERKVDSADNTFLRLRYEGGRFATASIPLTYLAELRSLQRAVEALYRERFFSKHPGRERMPRGFKAALELSLTAVKRGSAVACLTRQAPQQGQLFEDGDPLEPVIDDFLDFLDDNARTLGSTAAPEPTSRKIIAACIKEFGSSLADDEAIILEKKQRSVKYDQVRRRRILEQLSASYIRTEERVFAVSMHSKRLSACELYSPEGWTISNLPLAWDSEWSEALLRAFQGYESFDRNLKVLVSGTFTYEGNRITKVEPESIEPVGERDLRWRIPFLVEKNRANPEALKTLQNFQRNWFKSIDPNISEHPALYLLDEDTVSAEWDTPEGEVSLTREGDSLVLLFLRKDGAEDELETKDWSEAARTLGEWLS